jgi:hypothetical protein
VDGSTAYVADGEEGLQIIDVSDPAAPSLLSNATMFPGACEVALLNGFAYVTTCSDPWSGLHVVDVSNPAQPLYVGRTGEVARGVAVSGDHVFVAAAHLGLHVYPRHCEVVPVLEAVFELSATNDAVTMSWSAAGEWHCIGYHIDRAEAGSSDFTRRTHRLIRAIADPGVIYTYRDSAIASGDSYTYRLSGVHADGSMERIAEKTVTVGGAAPRQLVLYQNHPNPFNPSTEIAFDLPAAQRVTLRIYDVAGRSVRTLVDGRLDPDVHRVRWDGRDDRGRRLGSGVYFYRLHSGENTLTRKLMLLK